jgi:hypothetical protein
MQVRSAAVVGFVPTSWDVAVARRFALNPKRTAARSGRSALVEKPVAATTVLCVPTSG